MIKFGPETLRIPRFEKPVFAVAAGLTDYRKRYPEKNSSELCVEAMRMAAGISSGIRSGRVTPEQRGVNADPE